VCQISSEIHFFGKFGTIYGSFIKEIPFLNILFIDFINRATIIKRIKSNTKVKKYLAVEMNGYEITVTFGFYCPLVLCGGVSSFKK
jgi:hypothetical protein